MWVAGFGVDQKTQQSKYQQARAARNAGKLEMTDWHKIAELERIEKQIGVDLPRVFLAAHISSEERRAALGEVLRAWAFVNPEISYVQGMHAIAGAALLPTTAETDPPSECDQERAFCLLDIVVNELLPAFFAPGMPGLLVEQAVLERLLGEQRPELARRLGELGIMMTLLPTTSWFLTLFQQEGALREEEAARAMDELCARRLTPLQLALHLLLKAEPLLLKATDVAKFVTYLHKAALFDGVVDGARDVQLPSDAVLQAMREEEADKLRQAQNAIEARRCLRQVQNSTHFDYETVVSLQRRFHEVTSRGRQPIDADSSDDDFGGGGGGGSGGRAPPEEPSIDQTTFREVLRAAAPDSANYSDEMVGQIFAVADVSGDGKLQFSELASMLSIICKGSLSEVGLLTRQHSVAPRREAPPAEKPLPPRSPSRREPC